MGPDDLESIRRALRLAAPHRPHPNPRVGAVVLDRAGGVVGEGAHRAAGEPHAEVVALRAAGEAARNGTVAVTLEPCDHHGRTPPCTEAIIDAGARRVVIGALDPDPRVAGSGVRRLREAGVEVTGPVAQDEVESADPAYFHHRRTGLPLLTLKVAATLDGQTAAADGSSRWITGEEARQDGHRLRAAADAVMVGAGTLRADDPELTVRIAGWDGPQPVPIVVAGHGDLPPDRRLWDRDPLVLAPDGVTAPGGRVIEVPPGAGGIDLAVGMRAVAAEGLLDVLVEGGSGLAGSLWRAGLVGRGSLYLGAMMAGGRGIPILAGQWPTMGEASRVEITRVTRLGADVRIDWRTAG